MFNCANDLPVSSGVTAALRAGAAAGGGDDHRTKRATLENVLCIVRFHEIYRLENAPEGCASSVLKLAAATTRAGPVRANFDFRSRGGDALSPKLRSLLTPGSCALRKLDSLCAANKLAQRKR